MVVTAPRAPLARLSARRTSREPGLHLAALGAHAADVVERVAEAALADAGDLAEYGNRDRFADATAQERFDALDDLAPGRERLGAMEGGC